LSGQGSKINHALNKYFIDFQQIPFTKQSPGDFFIENHGKVPFEFSINLETLSRPGILDVNPL
jgi:hypothetical protein